MKQIKVAFISRETEEAFEKLKQGKYEEKQLYEYIERARDDLRKNPQAGIRVPNHLVPKFYIKKYGADSIWKYNLPNAWRLVYTIRGNEVMIVSIILEWLDHKEYERRFKYG